MEGFVKIHRKILENAVFSDSDVLKVWLYCILKATHKERMILVGRQKVDLLPGQFVSGRKKDAERLGMSDSKLYRILKQVEDLGCISLKANSKFTVITVANWALYQVQGTQPEQQENSKRTADGQQMNIKRTTDEQQMNTNKNDKNVKECEEGVIGEIEPEVQPPPKAKKAAKEKFDFEAFLSEQPFNESVKQALREYRETRLAMDTKPVDSSQAWVRLFNILKDIKNDGHKLAMIDKSIMNSWKTFYPLKPDEIRNIPQAKKETQAFDADYWSR